MKKKKSFLWLYMWGGVTTYPACNNKAKDEKIGFPGIRRLGRYYLVEGEKVVK